jgi:hypothetical protein
VLRKIRGAWTKKSHPPSEGEKMHALKCSEVMKMYGEEKLREIVDSILLIGNDDPVGSAQLLN